MSLFATAAPLLSVGKNAFHVAFLFLQAQLSGPGPHSLVHPKGPQGSSIEHLFWIIFLITLAVFILVMIGFSTASARTYSPEIDVHHVIEDEGADRRSTLFVGTATGVTVVTLFIVLFLSIKVGR